MDRVPDMLNSLRLTSNTSDISYSEPVVAVTLLSAAQGLLVLHSSSVSLWRPVIGMRDGGMARLWSTDGFVYNKKVENI